MSDPARPCRPAYRLAALIAASSCIVLDVCNCFELTSCHSLGVLSGFEHRCMRVVLLTACCWLVGLSLQHNSWALEQIQEPRQGTCLAQKRAQEKDRGTYLVAQRGIGFTRSIQFGSAISRTAVGRTSFCIPSSRASTLIAEKSCRPHSKQYRPHCHHGRQGMDRGALVVRMVSKNKLSQGSLLRRMWGCMVGIGFKQIVLQGRAAKFAMEWTGLEIPIPQTQESMAANSGQRSWKGSGLHLGKIAPTSTSASTWRTKRQGGQDGTGGSGCSSQFWSSGSPAVSLNAGTCSTPGFIAGVREGPRPLTPREQCQRPGEGAAQACGNSGRSNETTGKPAFKEITILGILEGICTEAKRFLGPAATGKSRCDGRFRRRRVNLTGHHRNRQGDSIVPGRQREVSVAGETALPMEVATAEPSMEEREKFKKREESLLQAVKLMKQDAEIEVAARARDGSRTPRRPSKTDAVSISSEEHFHGDHT